MAPSVAPLRRGFDCQRLRITERNMTTGSEHPPRRTSGRCANDAQGGTTTAWHAVPPGFKFGKGLCGIEPGQRSIGRVEPLTRRVEVTCPQCLRTFDR